MGLYLMGTKSLFGKIIYFILNLIIGLLMVFCTWGDNVFYYVSIIFITTMLIYFTMNNMSLIWLNLCLDKMDITELKKYSKSYMHYGDIALCLSLVVMALYGKINNLTTNILLLIATIAHILLTLRRIYYKNF